MLAEVAGGLEMPRFPPGQISATTHPSHNLSPVEAMHLVAEDAAISLTEADAAAEATSTIVIFFGGTELRHPLVGAVEKCLEMTASLNAENGSNAVKMIGDRQNGRSGTGSENLTVFAEISHRQGSTAGRPTTLWLPAIHTRRRHLR